MAGLDGLPGYDGVPGIDGSHGFPGHPGVPGISAPAVDPEYIIDLIEQRLGIDFHNYTGIILFHSTFPDSVKCQRKPI